MSIKKVVGFVVASFGFALTAIAGGDWSCESIISQQSREWCQKARDAKPYEYKIEAVGEGREQQLCVLMLQNLRAMGEPPTCELRILPQYEKYFQLPKWEVLDAWADPEYIYQLELASRGGLSGTREIDKVSKKAWLESFKEKLKENNRKVILKRSRFDLNGDGREDWILAYGQDAIGCNSWSDLYRRGYSYLYGLEVDGRTLDQDLGGGPFSGGEQPFIYLADDDRFPGAHTFRLYNTGGKELTIFGSYGNKSTGKIPACTYRVAPSVSKKSN